MSFGQHQDTELWNYQLSKELRFHGACTPCSPLTQHEVPLINTSEATQRKTEKRTANVQKMSWEDRSGVGLSTLFYTDHDPPVHDVIDLD